MYLSPFLHTLVVYQIVYRNALLISAYCSHKPVTHSALPDPNFSLRPRPLFSLFSCICRVLQESLYGYHVQHYRNGGDQTNDALVAPTITVNALPDGIPQHAVVDPDLAMALRISEQEQQLRQDELQREQEMIEEALRLSLQEK